MGHFFFSVFTLLATFVRCFFCLIPKCNADSRQLTKNSPWQAKREELEKRLEDVQKTLGGDAKAKRAAKAAKQGNNAANPPNAANPSAGGNAAANAADSSSSSDSDSSNSSSSSSDSDSDSESETSPTKKAAPAPGPAAAGGAASQNISVRRDLMPGAGNPAAAVVPAGASLLNPAATGGVAPPPAAAAAAAAAQHSQQLPQQQLSRGDSVDGGPTKTKAALKGKELQLLSGCLDGEGYCIVSFVGVGDMCLGNGHVFKTSVSLCYPTSALGRCLVFLA